MDNKRLGKALDIMRLAEEAAARPGGISLVQIVDTFGVTLRTAQRMSRALEEAFPMVQTPHRQGTAQVVATARQPFAAHAGHSRQRIVGAGNGDPARGTRRRGY